MMRSKIFAFLSVLSLIFTFGCSSRELKTGKYILQGTEVEGWAWVLLKEDSKFVFNRNMATSYLPIGTYEVNDGILVLTVSTDETYRFRIEGDTLVFESGKMAEPFIEKGAIFKLQQTTNEIGKSSKFTEDEINKAIDLVQTSFNFPAATLVKLTYDEEKSEQLINGYMQNGKGSINGVDPKNVIILLSEFHVDGSGKNPVLNPNSTYTDYMWILIRKSADSDWIIDDQGY